eukprot:gene6732-13629_t
MIRLTSRVYQAFVIVSLVRLSYAELNDFNTTYSPSGLPTASPLSIDFNQTTSFPSGSPTASPMWSNASIATSVLMPSVQPTNSPILPTLAPVRDRPFATIVNGGFEEDKDIVEARGGGFYSMLPFGWDQYRAAVMINYAIVPNHKQANSGDIFMSIFASHHGFIEQNVSSCRGLQLTLSFTAASYACNGCGFASFDVYIGDQIILQESLLLYEWTSFNVSFTSPGYLLAVKFQPRSSQAQLLLDNIELTSSNQSSCAPTAAPTSGSPTLFPTGRPSQTPTLVPTTPTPSLTPTTASPSTASPTSNQIMDSITGRMSLQYICFSEKMTSVDMYVMQNVLTDIMEPAAKTIKSFVKVEAVASQRVNDKVIYLFFKVNIMRSLAQDEEAPDSNAVFYATKQCLFASTSTGGDFLKTLDNALSNVNGSTLAVFSSSTATLDYYSLNVAGTNRVRYYWAKVESNIIIASILGVTIGVGILVTIGSRLTRRRLTPEDDEKSLLGLSQGFSQELELSQYVKSTATDFEKVMSSSLHSLIPEQAP